MYMYLRLFYPKKEIKKIKKSESCPCAVAKMKDVQFEISVHKVEFSIIAL